MKPHSDCPNGCSHKRADAIGSASLSRFKKRSHALAVLGLLLTVPGLTRGQSPVADSFNPAPRDLVQTLAVQTDGKVIVRAGYPSMGIIRLHPDGTLDSGFNPALRKSPGAEPDARPIAVLPDGGILLGGHFDEVNGHARTNLVRLHVDGTLDDRFDPLVTAEAEHPSGVAALAVQADGKILVSEGCAWCTGALVRLNVDGRMDAGFAIQHMPYGPQSLAIQPDGKILISGIFESIAGQPRTNIARLNPGGTLDLDFNPGADGPVRPITLQPDGRILVLGDFTTVAGQARTNIARLHPDGTLDTSFQTAVDGWVHSLAQQADGMIILGGQFTMVNGQRRIGLARLNTDGTLDDEFNPGVDGPISRWVASIALQPDGRILVGGDFTRLGGQPRTNLGRLNNTSPATQNLSYDGSTITWLRGGSSPEVWRTVFETSNNGATWTHLGAGERFPGGWRLAEASVAPGTTIRARGYVVRGGMGEGVVESTMRTLVPPAFTKITISPVVSDQADGEGAAWADFDNDGDLDLSVVSSATVVHLLYRNDGTNGFTQMQDGVLSRDATGAETSVWADFDNDGLPDVFVSKAGGYVFRQSPPGTFTRSSLGAPTVDWGVAAADFNNDGFVDLIVRSSDSRRSVWRNHRSGSFTPMTNSPVVTSGTANIAASDFDNDGDMDVFLSSDATANRGLVYRNDGNGVFTQITTGPVATRTLNTTGAAWGDYDKDGFPDLIVGRLDFSRPLAPLLFHNQGAGTFTQVELSPFTEPIGQIVGSSWGDYDNDGWLDLFVCEFGGQSNRLFHNNGDGTFTRVLAGEIANDNGSSTAGIWGDYDRDGFLDLFVANGTNGGGDSSDFLYHNSGNNNAWITIRPIGTISNRSAIGAKVRVKATINGKSFWQLREINTGDGWVQNPLEVHFGLGTANNAETLRIEWPSGTVQEFENVAAKQYLTVTEPARLSATEVNGAPQFTLHGGRGMQYEIQTSTNLIEWSLLTSVAITNLNGRALISDTNELSSAPRFYRGVLR